MSTSDAAPAPIPHSRPTLGPEALQALAEVIGSGFVGQGPRVTAFEEAMASALGVTGGVATSSGTAALHLALLALDVSPGDEVLLPAYTCAALLHAVRAVGARPRLVDCDPQSFNMDPDAAKRACSPRARAVIVVHSFGLPAEIDALRTLGLPVIEDLAQAVGAAYREQPVGSFGDLAVCSFYATKVITTGEGGMLCSGDARLLADARDRREYDQKADDRPRLNYKMSDLAAALGLTQLTRLPAFLAQRRAIAAAYRARLEPLPVRLPGAPADRTHAYYRYVVTGTTSADHALARFHALGVEARRPVFRPLHRYLGAAGFPGTDEAWARAISLPLYPALTDEEIDRVARAAQEIMR